MKIVEIRKASAIDGRAIEETQINLFLSVQSCDTLEEYRQLYETEGNKLFVALVNSLPGGTLDALLRNLLNYRASLLRVPFPDKEVL